jgi:hypothetical protein
MTISVTGSVHTILNAFERYGTSHTFDLSHMTRGQEVELTLPGDSTRIKLPCISYLPALVAIHKKLPASVIRHQLESQGIALAELLQLEFPETAFDFQDSPLNAFHISRDLLLGLEANRMPETYGPEAEIQLPMKIAMLSSANPSNWIPERLQRLSDKVTEGIAEARDFLNLDLDEYGWGLLDEASMPNANKYDFAHRKGFFSEVLASKRLSVHGFYEHLLSHAYGSDDVWKNAIEFYFRRLPEPQKGAFIKGFETSIPCLANDSLDNASVSYAYQWLIDQLKKWEIPGTLTTLTMRLNYLPTVPVTKASSMINDSTAFDDLLESPQDTFALLANEIAELEPEQYCLAHFHAFLQIERQGHLQHTHEIDPHAFTLKALQALDHFSMPDGAEPVEQKSKVDKVARDGVRAMITELLRSHDFDHTVFKGQSSRNIALLVESGLDPRQLPRMKYTDMARAFTNVLGV